MVRSWHWKRDKSLECTWDLIWNGSQGRILSNSIIHNRKRQIINDTTPADSKINKSGIADEPDHSLDDDIKSLNKYQNFIY